MRSKLRIVDATRIAEGSALSRGKARIRVMSIFVALHRRVILLARRNFKNFRQQLLLVSQVSHG